MFGDPFYTGGKPLRNKQPSFLWPAALNQIPADAWMQCIKLMIFTRCNH